MLHYEFFRIQKIWIVLRRCLFLKICSHIFLIFEVKLDDFDHAETGTEAKKTRGSAAWNFFRSNFNLVRENGVWSKIRFRFLACVLST